MLSFCAISLSDRIDKQSFRIVLEISVCEMFKIKFQLAVQLREVLWLYYPFYATIESQICEKYNEIITCVSMR